MLKVEQRIVDCFFLTVTGILLTLAVMALAWSIFPAGHNGAAGYEWWHWDLSTLGRISLHTAEGRTPHGAFSVYNFALLIWGIACVPFWCARAMLLPAGKRVNLLLVCGFMMALGVIGIGITPKDAPRLWGVDMHVAGSVTAILAFIVALVSLKRDEEPLRRWWLWSAVACLPLYLGFQALKGTLPYGTALFQKGFVLFIFAYLAAQSALLARRVRAGKTAAPENLETLRRFGAGAVAAGSAAMLALMALAAAVFPGDGGAAGFRWAADWMSVMGNIRLTDAAGAPFIYDKFMLYNGALAVGGVGIAVFWLSRSFDAGNAAFGRILLIGGLATGFALAGIGMAPEGAFAINGMAVKLHRWCINAFMAGCGAMLIAALFRGAGDAMPRGWRWAWLAVILAAALIGALDLGGRPVRVHLQKALVLLAVLWLMCEGYFTWRASKAK